MGVKVYNTYSIKKGIINREVVERLSYTFGCFYNTHNFSAFILFITGGNILYEIDVEMLDETNTF